MKNTVFEMIKGIYVVFKREFFSNLKSIRMIILMVIFSLLVLLTVFGSFMLMGMASDLVGPEISEMMVNQGPVFILNSLSGMMGFIGPITAIALSFDIIVKEKTQNSIFLLLCRPVGRRSIAVGKFFGVIGALAVPIIIVNTIAIIVVIFLSEKGISAGQAGGFLLYSLIFLAIYAALGQLISSSVKSTTTAILLGIVIWIFLPVIVGVVSSYAGDVSDQIALLNPATSYGSCVSHALGTYSEQASDPVPLWGYYLTFFLWLFIPLILGIEIFNRKEI